MSDTAERSLDAIAKLVENQGHALDVETLAMIVRLSGRDVADSLPGTPASGPNELAKRIQAYLFPERFGVDHELHDPDHPYWGTAQVGDDYAWDSETTNAVHAIVEEYIPITDLIEAQA